MGVDAQNFGWVGEWNSKKLRRLTPQSGATVKELDLPVNPYGLVIDANGILWVSGRGGSKLVRVDLETDAIDSYIPNLGGCFQPYGITLDPKGRVWVANCCCWHVTYRFDPTTLEWAAAEMQARPRGVAASIYGNVYVANDQSHKVAVVDSDAAQTLAYVDLGAGRFPIGVAVDFDEFVWTVNQTGNSVSKIDTTNLVVAGEYPIGNGPYTYSDMTGYILHNFTATQNLAYYTSLFGDAEGPSLLWKLLNLELEADSPDCAELKVFVRAGDTPGDLAGGAWVEVAADELADQVEIDLEPFALTGKLMEIRLAFYVGDGNCIIKVKSIHAVYTTN